MARERKASTLNLTSPVTPPATVSPTEPAKTAQSASKKNRYYFMATAEDEGRIRAAYAAVAGIGPGRFSSYNDFKLTAMLAFAQQVEETQGDGAPLPAAPPRFAPGRPLKGI